MKKKLKSGFIGFFTENFSYKVVSLFIALILWTTILGRRDFTYTKVVDLEFKVAAGYSIVARPEEVRLRVSGTRTTLRRFMDQTADRPLIIDLTGRNAGSVEMDVPLSQLDLPNGLKILSVRPALIRAEIFKSPEPEPSSLKKESL
ncbi:MAG TPA: hypothetical protein PL182_06050 [Pseudobdellovibrionaceae bacterium]|nr:hypothetical protein [Pseudobdellovibrionaceae bacterium]